MPIYEYYCPKCNSKFEILRSISQSNEMVSCPKCQSSARKIFSRFASFTKDNSGASTPIAGTGKSCGGCSATSCGNCH
jgi:putative FmdB family regulatory protein